MNEEGLLGSYAFGAPCLQEMAMGGGGGPPGPHLKHSQIVGLFLKTVWPDNLCSNQPPSPPIGDK